jgi:hypothetical protein
MSESEDRDPLIVTGVPRSGIRLMAALLDAHHELASGPDLPFLVTVAMQWKEIATTLGENHAKYHALGPEAVRNAFRLAVNRLLEPRLKAEGKTRFVVQSFAALLSLESMAQLFPTARIILMVRDPRGVAQSLLRCDWRNPQDGRPLPYTRDAVAGGRLWAEFMRTSLPNVTSLESAGRLMIVRYEDLCSASEATLAKVGAFIGSAAPPGEVRKASAGFVVASPDNQHPSLRVGRLDTASVHGWKSSMPIQVANAIRTIASPIAERFGYP